MSRGTHGRDGGFTLLELLAVLAATAAVIWLSIPLLTTGFGPSRRLQDATSKIVAALQDSRSLAMSRGRTVRAVLGAQRITSDAGVEIDLPKWLSVEPAATSLFVAFKPDGTATPIAFSLKDGNRLARIRIDWFTGRTTVAFEG